MKKSKQIAFCGMLAALSLALMFLGSVIYAFTYVAPLFCSVIMLIICDVIGKRNALITFIAVSIISIVFLPDKECALTYAFFFGYYVIIKDYLERIKPRFLCFLTKLAIYNIGIISSQLLLIYVFGIPLDNPFGKWGIAVLIMLANTIFIVYELMLSRVTKLYDIKYKNKVRRLLR
ncbi:MAG: hypothetical protein IJ731_02205 [Eubacterium sp.]|nr:hypothetical protein [Eubacterium sp.]